MAHELEPLDISHLPDLMHLAEEVQRTRTPRRLRRASEDVAILTPAPKRRRGRSRVLTEEDPLFRLVGIGRSGGSGDVSANKHHYLAEAYHAEASPDPSL